MRRCEEVDGMVVADRRPGSDPDDQRFSVERASGSAVAGEAATTPNNSRILSSECPFTPYKDRNLRRSATSKSTRGFAVRNLNPVFNGFSAAAERAQSLGGRFAVVARSKTGRPVKLGATKARKRRKIVEEDVSAGLSVNTRSQCEDRRAVMYSPLYNPNREDKKKPPRV